jgi:hypothetical protein
MSISWTLLRDWLAAESGFPWKIGPTDEEMPDVYGVLTAAPFSAGLILDEAFDQPTAQLNIRGVQRVQESPNDEAMVVDKLLILGDYPHDLWGDRCISVYRFGGPPSPLVTLDSGRRRTMTCTYVFQVAY